MEIVDLSSYENAIFDFLNQAVNDGAAEGSAGTIPIILAETHGEFEDGIRPQPGQSFIEFKFLSGLSKVGVKDEYIFEANRCFVRGQRQVTVQVTCFGESSYSIVATIQNALDLPEPWNILKNAGLSVRGDESFSDATVLLETDFEERAIFDIIFGIAFETEIDPGKIETVEVTANVPSGKVSTIDKVTGTSVTDP